METNSYEAALYGIPGPIVYRVPPPALLDEDDPLVGAARELAPKVQAYADVLGDDVYNLVGPRTFLSALRVLYERDVEAIERTARLQRFLRSLPPIPGEAQDWVLLACVPTHPGKELPYPVPVFGHIPIEERLPSHAPREGDTAVVAKAKEIYTAVEDFCDYVEARWLDYETLQAWTFLSLLDDVILASAQAADRQVALRERLVASGMPLYGQPND